MFLDTAPLGITYLDWFRSLLPGSTTAAPAGAQ